MLLEIVAAALGTGAGAVAVRPFARARRLADLQARAERGQEHRRRTLRSAADMAITSTPSGPDGHRYVTVARVQALAAEHFAVRAGVEEAAAALAARLHHRGWLGIRTDLLDPS
ncbi:hypothetical protein DR950_41805 [Kitasatospora xanthocidica]|uniref:Uncharacterized protein n=1 Tax=Kitasatospora xanthocidica TaxID=83382 RepID=A0A372ZI26_9ACTN|nr:hypothetical protein [Kitasatospora xanthocidica]RGD55401.1 hypothetical protein DR950_41805 [Kitasatospora xanthocidica]